MTQDMFFCTRCNERKVIVSKERIAPGYMLVQFRCRNCNYRTREVVRLADIDSISDEAFRQARGPRGKKTKKTEGEK